MKLSGQCSLVRKDGDLTAKGDRDCQHRAVWELGSDGKANEGELPSKRR